MKQAGRRFLAVAVGLLLCAHGLAGQSGNSSSNEGALFLLLPVGAQGVSLGRAMTAMTGMESAFWNPAGLADVAESRVVLLRGDHAVGTATAVSLIGARPGLGTLGFSYLLLDVGDQDLTDGDGNVLGTVSVRNHLGVASAAARILDRLDAGVNFKVVQFRLSCRGICQDAGTTATTYAVDAGLQLKPSGDLPLRFGAMLAHLGPRLQVFNAEQADPLPARFRVAAAYDVIRGLVHSEGVSGWLSLEVQDRLREPGSPSVFLGSELIAGQDDALVLRAGYVMGDLDQENGARVGLGLRYERFDLAIAKSLAVSTLTGETEPVHVTFSILF
ncbi:MAG TPA: PorV/PorQ family protein [Longimicrobiales bacterium]|nr:PorV/PorQ family protein [Longimicrobiales bacterium]